MPEGGGLSYRDAGVDLDAAGRTKEALKKLVERTRDPRTLSQVGSFGGLYALPAEADGAVLVASADGVGTKLRVAFLAGRHDTVGQDLVNHCVNDILVQGATPLFFLDYLATGRLEPDVVTEIVRGLAEACHRNRCVLLGGETAEMPDFYASGEYDLAGFIVGMAHRGELLDGSSVREGDRILALASSGLHTNGYSLARKIVFERMGLGVDDPMPSTEGTVAEALLSVHRSYLDSVRPLLGTEFLHALCHVTGGGIPGNLPRVLPPGLGARIYGDSWQPPGIFRALQEGGGVAEEEMRRVFNLGIGFMAVVGREATEEVARELRARGEECWVCGEIVRGSGVQWV